MPRKSKPERVEVLPPAPQMADVKKLIAEAVEQRVAELMSGSGAEFEPWFRPKKISDEIRRQQGVIEQRKWMYYFEDWGCLICGATDSHYAHGMCGRCSGRTAQRLKASMRKREKQTESDRSFDDSLRLAREALAGQLPPLPEKPARKRGPHETS